MFATNISSNLMAYLRGMYKNSLLTVKKPTAIKVGSDFFTPHAIPAYTMAVVAVEAFINEMFISEFSPYKSKITALLSADWLERVEIGQKIILFPELAFGKTMDKSAEPHQSMTLLIKLRNELVHYKMKAETPKPVEQLVEKKIAGPLEESGAIHPWPFIISTTEGVRWAHNVASRVIRASANLAEAKDPSLEKGFLDSLGGFVSEISEADRKELLEQITGPHGNNSGPQLTVSRMSLTKNEGVPRIEDNGVTRP